jgi:multiple sugar transport system permease protein
VTDLNIQGEVTPVDTAAPLTGPAPQEAIHHRPTLADRTRSVFKHILLIVASVIMIYPLLWMIASSFRPTEIIFRSPGLWVNDLYVQNYTKGWYALSYPFGQYIINSFIVVIGAIAGNLFACTLAAYAFARLKFRLRGLWFAIMLLTIMLPFHVVIVPQYIIFNKLGFVNTFVPLILPKFLATDAFFVFLMVQFIRGIPRELDEAARIDGCGVHGPRRAAHVFVGNGGEQLGSDVRHVSRHLDPALPGVLVRPAVLGPGHRHYRRKVTSVRDPA